MERRNREFVDRVLAEHEAQRVEGRTGACCVFADELGALRAEYDELAERTDELVALLEYLIATDSPLERSRADVYRRASSVREVLPINPNTARG
jgi:hypothetical protein